MSKIHTSALFTNEAVTASGTITSTAVELEHIVAENNYSLAMAPTGSGVFNVAYQVSYDNTNWATPSTASNIKTGLTASGTTLDILSFTPVLAPYLRFTVTETLGASGTISLISMVQ